jgi:7-carboxy-7-deazaguanine synthase
MKINEIFYSLQGEGLWTGLPNIFIRLTGCNLRCSYCDTKYAYHKGEENKIKDIIRKISRYQCKYICITGGEPLLQKDVYDLIDNLIEDDYNICIETNGSIGIKRIANIPRTLISMDIKCPSSKMQDKNILGNLEYLRKTDQLKFIIKEKNDYEFAKGIINEHQPNCSIFFQPVWNTDPVELADWIISDKLNVRLGLQLHKILWRDIKKK